MPAYFDLEKYDKDPLDLIVKHKDIVKHLRENGIDGQEIKKMLCNSHGLKSEIPVRITKQEAAARRQIDYAMRHLKALVSSLAITDKEKHFLVAIYNRLYQAQAIWEKGKSGNPVIKWEVGDGDGDAKTLKQMIGMRVAFINKYILTFNKKMYLQKDIFDLIAELFEVYMDTKYTQRQIANFDKNNCKFLYKS
jgi:hypothetical protein